ncbi:MAG: hypothetical protein ABIA77_05930 [Candidatus Omnitrophota bacterium]
MSKAIVHTSIVIALVSVFTLACAAPAFADRGRRWKPYPKGGRHHHAVISTPEWYVPAVFRSLARLGRYRYENRVTYVQPVVVTTPSNTVVVRQMPVTPAADSVTVNIPNANGSYITVVLRRAGNGYIGPQGEYYPGHPTIEQLAALYGN